MRARLSPIPVVTALISPASQHRTPDRGSETMRHSCRQPGHRAPPGGSAEASRQTMACPRPWRTGQGPDAPVPQCSLGQLVPDQARVQVPALRTPAGALDPRHDNVPIAGPDDPQPPANPGTCAPSAPTGRCSGPAWPSTGTRPCRPARRGWPGRRARTCTCWTAGRRDRPGPGQVRRPGDRLDAHGHRSSDVLPRSRRPSLLSQFLSHSPASGAVHQRPPRSCSGRSRTVAAIGERWSALLESVLGAPQGPGKVEICPGLSQQLRWPRSQVIGSSRVV